MYEIKMHGIWKCRAGQLLGYFRQYHAEDKSPHTDKEDTRSRGRFASVGHELRPESHKSSLDIQDHPLVQEWRDRLMAMNSDLSALFANNDGAGLIHRIGMNNAVGIEKWHAACTMSDSIEFQDELRTEFLHMDLTSYIRKRVSHVITCLDEIRGPSRQYVQYSYVEPWQTLLGPDHSF